MDNLFTGPETPSLFAEWAGREIAKMAGNDKAKAWRLVFAISRAAMRECGK
jgi:hypothetical protein